MSSISISGYSVLNGVASIVTSQPHGLSVGDYISVRNVNSNVNGEYFITGTPVDVTLTYDVPGAQDTLATNVVGGFLITTTINELGKPAFIYDKSIDTWYQISGKVNTNGNYTWTGTHLHQAPVTMEDILILDNLSASPSASPVGGGYLYVENGALKFMGGNGTITTIAPA